MSVKQTPFSVRFGALNVAQPELLTYEVID
jgi:hypothetical protein